MRSALAGLLAIALLAGQAPAASVVDLAGRHVELPADPRRILLGVGIELPTLTLIDPDIVSRLVGIGTDLETFDAGTYRALVARFPHLRDVPKTATGMGGIISVEQALSVRPDLVIFTLWQRARVRPALAAFAKAGIPVIFVDFYDEPIANVGRSLELLGRALGRPDAADRYRTFYAERLARLSRRLGALTGPRPRVYFEPLHSPRGCCWSTGSDSFGAFLAFLRAESIGAETAVGAGGGVIGLEFLLARRPDVMITTFGSAAGDGDVPALGPGTSPDVARLSILGVASLGRVQALPAGRDRRVHGLWNFFNGSPLNIAALEAMATWLYPDAFADLDPQGTLQEIQAHFLPQPMAGTYWVSSEGAPGSVLGVLSPEQHRP